eukprot:GHVL01015434.1.p1 GENE.GHVL01015434.1~~GHVL01015434.1.p1  ORF type:complete len:258 (+),score=57.66 GHVL01015434.1:847-1620(+)
MAKFVIEFPPFYIDVSKQITLTSSRYIDELNRPFTSLNINENELIKGFEDAVIKLNFDIQNFSRVWIVSDVCLMEAFEEAVTDMNLKNRNSRVQTFREDIDSLEFKTLISERWLNYKIFMSRPWSYRVKLIKSFIGLKNNRIDFGVTKDSTILALELAVWFKDVWIQPNALAFLLSTDNSRKQVFLLSCLYKKNFPVTPCLSHINEPEKEEVSNEIEAESNETEAESDDSEAESDDSKIDSDEAEEFDEFWDMLHCF